MKTQQYFMRQKAENKYGPCPSHVNMQRREERTPPKGAINIYFYEEC